ncbi:MAG: hypothetical protein JOZ98_03245 [Solirubrobacterales bacterium]|nr:hypothetical protein [Solirubrobacterales bacterium]MBV9421901.1 hypothetical protein [Solirubrobacterales bacterium]MBV9800722.1 hypothetical protein [Solirubrobacterales bacterium]
MPSKHRSQRELESESEPADQSAYEALTDLSAYALTLDAECHRLDDRIFALAEVESSVMERRELLRERDEISEELSALRHTITSLQDQIREQGQARGRRRPRERR